MTRGYGSPFSWSEGNTQLSYLTFVDNLILFAKVDMEQMEEIKLVIKFFCGNLSEKINHDKMRIFFSKNVNCQAKEEISKCVPIFQKRTTKQGFCFFY